jgi:hypothetical protein
VLIHLPTQPVIVQVLARFQFDLVLRVFGFSEQFSAFDVIPSDRANLFNS